MQEVITPTHERLIKQPMIELENGAYQIEISSIKSYMESNGMISAKQAYAADVFCLMRYIATRHTAPKAVAIDEDFVTKYMADDIPTLRDGYHHILRNLRKSTLEYCELVVEPLSESADFRLVKLSTHNIRYDIEYALDQLAACIDDFYARKKTLAIY